MVQLGGFFCEFTGSLVESVFKEGIEAAKEDLPILANNLTKY